MGGEIAVALVIGEQEDDVRLFTGQTGGVEGAAEANEGEKGGKADHVARSNDASRASLPRNF